MKQILMERYADVLNVVRRELGFVAETLRHVTLGTARHGSELGTTNPMARHSKPHFIRNGTRKRARFRVRSGRHVHNLPSLPVTMTL